MNSEYWRLKNEEYKAKILPTIVDRIFALSMGYKKDIFGIFAYEFELSHQITAEPCIPSMHIIFKLVLNSTAPGFWVQTIM